MKAEWDEAALSWQKESGRNRPLSHNCPEGYFGAGAVVSVVFLLFFVVFL